MTVIEDPKNNKTLIIIFFPKLPATHVVTNIGGSSGANNIKEGFSSNSRSAIGSNC